MNQEATRCLLCKKAKCREACAVRTDVPAAMKLYRENLRNEASELLFANNPLSAITCRVCDWSKMCLGHCVLNAKGQPVRWHEIERELSEAYLKQAKIRTGQQNGLKVSVVGAGPAGIAAAAFLREQGFSVTLYDEHERIGGVLRYGIPDFRLEKSSLAEYERILDEASVEFRGGIKIGRDMSLSGLRESSDAVLLAGGAWKPRKLDIPGEEGNPHVIYALHYLKNPGAFRLGRKVIVIGGGNVTMDASRTACRRGSEAYVYYRKTFANMPANGKEIKDALEDGVKFELFEVPVAINGTTAVMRKCENVIREDGSVATRMIEGTDHEVDFDSMIVAISENVNYGIFGEDMPATDAHGTPIVDEWQQTSIGGVFMAGDFLHGPQTVVEAVQSAKIAVQGIIGYIS